MTTAKRASGDVLKHGPERLASMALLAAAIVAFGWAWMKTVNHKPLVAFAPPPVTTNRAYDLYLQANRSIVHPALFADRTAFRRLLKSPRLTEARNAIADNAAVLSKLDDISQLEFELPEKGDRNAWSIAFQLQPLSRLLTLRTRMREADGDWFGAANGWLAQLEFSENLLRGSGVDPFSMGQFYGSMAVVANARPFEQLNAGQLQSVQKRLVTINSRRPAFAAILTSEKWRQLHAIDSWLSNPNWRDQLSSSATGFGAPGRLAQMGQQAKWIGIDKRRVMQDYLRYMDQCIALAQPQVPSIPNYPAPPADPVNQAIAVDIRGANKQFCDIELQCDMLLLRVCLRRHFLDHGAYPASLEALCPTYLDRLPRNPLSPDGRFTYNRTRNAYTLVNPGAGTLRKGARMSGQY